MGTNTYSPELPAVPRRRLWFGFVAAPLAWAVDGAASWAITWLACYAGPQQMAGLGNTGIRAVLIVITLSLLAITLAAGFVSYRNWQALSEHRNFIYAEARGREEFMALTGVFSSIFFTFGIVLIAIPQIFINVCTTAW